LFFITSKKAKFPREIYCFPNIGQNRHTPALRASPLERGSLLHRIDGGGGVCLRISEKKKRGFTKGDIFGKIYQYLKKQKCKM
jgi:hypothetical protein